MLNPGVFPAQGGGHCEVDAQQDAEHSYHLDGDPAAPQDEPPRASRLAQSVHRGKSRTTEPHNHVPFLHSRVQLKLPALYSQGKQLIVP